MFQHHNYLKIFLLSLVSICNCNLTFRFPPICNCDRETTDCSFQFQSAIANDCRVYNTNACKKYNFSSWNLAPLSRPISEDDAEFSVTIVPYPAYCHNITRDNNQFLSAINITLTSSSKNINGFSIVMTSEDIKGKNACRILDFKKSVVKTPFMLFYDCFYKLVEDHWENVSIAFKAYPLNIELSYFVFIPPLPTKNTMSICEWKPLIMVFRGSLSKNNIHFKFSYVPENLNISFFNVMLVDSQNIEVHQKQLYHNKSRMILGEFLTVATGYYSLHISVPCGKSFTNSETSYFFVGEKAKDYSTTLLIVLLVLLIISVSSLIYFSGQWYIRKASPKSKPTLLFAYFHQSHLHNFLVWYSKHLENHYGVKANMIFARSGNPLTYLREKVDESDIIVFVLCQNLNAFERNNMVKGDHHWINQLSEAESLIEDVDVGSKRICNVYFSGSRTESKSNCGKHKGPIFMLPENLDGFLCFVFKCPPLLYILSKLFREDHHRVPKPFVNIEEEEELKRKLKDLLDAKEGKYPLLKGKSMLESEVKSEKVERKIFVSDQIYESPLSDNLLKKSQPLNQALNEEEDNSDDFKNGLKEKEDSDDMKEYEMRYFFRKLLYRIE